jgi:predicted transcriptional regulator
MSQKFFNLLFEVSNENRYKILTALQEKPLRITDISRDLELTSPEARRHLLRLNERGLIQRDIDGYYNLTPYGKNSLILLNEFEFISKNQEYFKTHDSLSLPSKFLKDMGKLMKTKLITNTMDFIRYTQNLLKESKKRVSVMVDQFPMTFLPNIVEAIDRGVTIRIIESKDQILQPNLSELTSEESKAVIRTKTTPLYQRRILENVQLQFFLSESQCVFSFPLTNHQFDYTGFLCDEEISLDWCNELFDYYWSQASPRISIESDEAIKRSYPISVKNQVRIRGVNNPNVDVQAVQDAVDNYREVILLGKFNFGASNILISKSVIIRGDGRENNIPLASIYKRGWSFPFRQFTGVFMVDEDDLDVTIENINFTDFNCACILSRMKKINSMNVLNNRIVLPTGYGRGITLGSFGDLIHGILISEVGKDGVLIEGNYIDLATVGFQRGSFSRGGLEDDPEFRPDLFNHEYFVGFGIAVNGCSGKVEIKNNIVRNANGRGIASVQNKEHTEVIIRDNEIKSDVYGSYPFSSRESGAGILVQTGMIKGTSNFDVCIEKNIIKLEKVNQSGILALGPRIEGSKLIGGVIRDNQIYLKNGYEGIHLRKCDDFEVAENKIFGEAYYGIRVSGNRKIGNQDLGSYSNQLYGNDLQGLVIKSSDAYVLNHSDGRMFSQTNPNTAHIWLDKFAKNTSILTIKKYSLIDEGEENKVIME